MRLFFAIELPHDVQAALGRLRPKDDNRDYRWSDPSLLHVTLAFLGEQPESQVEVLRRVGETAASASHAASLRLGTAGSFGSHRSPRVLWVGLEGDLEALSSLHARLDAGLREAGLPVEDRPFRAHVTLARRRETARGGPPPGWPPHDSLGPARFSMDHLTLFQSRLSPRGPTYTPVFLFPLGGG
jgi:RNA 2',3'-cyclic 3'-phosphodiesterase